MFSSIGLRSLVYLKRMSGDLKTIAKEFKRLNDLTEIRLRLERPEWSKSGKVSGAPKINRINYPTVEAWNENYRKVHPDAEDIEP